MLVYILGAYLPNSEVTDTLSSIHGHPYDLKGI